MDRRVFLSTAASVGATVALTGCIGSSAEGDYDIGMSTNRYRPNTFEVEPGTTVVWRNTSKQGHTITAYEDDIPDGADYWASGGYDSESEAREAWRSSSGGRLVQGDTFEHEFTTLGTHSYVCIPHEPNGMAGAIVVTENPDNDQ
jgi:plastocyanin